MKSSALAAGLKAAAGNQPVTIAPPSPAILSTIKAAGPGTQLVGAHYMPHVRRTLKLVEAETGRNLKELLGEAINDLCAKYGKPQPYSNMDY